MEDNETQSKRQEKKHNDPLSESIAEISEIRGSKQQQGPLKEAIEIAPQEEIESEIKKEEIKEGKKEVEEKWDTQIYALRTTANREDQVMDFIYANAEKKKIPVYSVVKPHGMRGYIFVEAASKADAEMAAANIPYARGILPSPVQYKEIEHMLEQVKMEVNIKKNDIAEIISGPFKREKCKITRVDKTKEEVIVELLEAAVPIPLTLKMDALKVIRRESEGGEPEEK